jgi:hypothetical protein
MPRQLQVEAGLGGRGAARLVRQQHARMAGGRIGNGRVRIAAMAGSK